jgi:hypothetical protein
MARDFGITNVAAYASAPAVGVNGATYWNTTSKLLYVSDGVAWVASPGASGGASGDLSGSYPGPTVAKVNGAALGTTTPLARGDILVANATPALVRLAKGAANTVLSSDGTDATWEAITQAKLPVAPTGIATTNLNVQASTPRVATATLAAAINLTATEQLIVRLASVTTRGGIVLYIAALTGTLTMPDAAAWHTMELRFYAGSTLVGQLPHAAFANAGIQNAYLPISYVWPGLWTSSVGTANLDLRALRTGGTGTWQVSAGTFFAVEYA